MLSYEELLDRSDGVPGSAWGVFGDDDELGCLNFLTPQRVLAAVSTVRSGETIGLDYALDHFDPPTANSRRSAHHVITQRHPDLRDDYLDSFYLQCTSQIDGLRHRRHEDFGFYNGVPDSEIVVGSPTLGVGRWADRGIVGRGVLVDIAGYLSAQGQSLNHAESEAFSVALVDEVLARQETRVLPGDIVILRTGFSFYFDNKLDASGRSRFAERPHAAGLVQSQESLAWLWNHQVAMLAADNIGVEAFPATSSSPFVTRHDDGLMHQQCLALLGLPLGELWRLDDLATACEARRSFEFLLVCKPLALTGGVGSPANAVAIL